MTRTGIRLKVVLERLALVEHCLQELRQIPASSLEEFQADRRNAPATHSHLQRGIEALFDTARHILSKHLGVGKLEYKQVARECVERGLIPDAELGRKFVEIGGFRNRLIHFYHEVTPEELFRILQQNLGDLEALIEVFRSVAGGIAADAQNHPQEET
jgi:uncharacterized protein YutE (UPF0331/DUF86 family)